MKQTATPLPFIYPNTSRSCHCSDETTDGKPLDRAYYDANMSGSSNDIIVPKLLPHWEHERMKVGRQMDGWA